MRKFKKASAIVVAAAMTVSMMACGGTTENTTTAPANDTEAGTDAGSDTTSEDANQGADTASYELIKVTAEPEKQKEVVPLTDGMEIVNVDFEDNTTNNFIKYNNGGTCDVLAEDGELVIDIATCGALDYANQVYWDGFALSHGCVYTYSFDIHSDINRMVEYRLQINGGDYHAYCGDYIQITPEKQNFEVDFTMEGDSDPAPRIVFNMGKMTDMSDDPGQHKIYIDNVKLVVKDATNAEIVSALPVNPRMVTNQIGYKPNDVKTVIVAADADEIFQVVDATTNEVVYQGQYNDAFYDKASEKLVRQGDFSAVTTPGTYYTISQSGQSYNFEISDTVYDDIYADVVKMLYTQRCGSELDDSIMGVFDHPACHTETAIVYGDEKVVDVTGGWHDAGDYGRYVVPGAKTIKDLFLAYRDGGQAGDDLGIPESGNGVPDLLDEARYELEWMLKMQDEETGGVYHKVTCLVFPETVMPEKETDQLYLAPISNNATGDFAAVMAEASVLYADYDAAFAATCLEAAKKAFAYYDTEDSKAEKFGFYNPEEIVTGEYPDNNMVDEKLWAAVELYAATKDDQYKQAVIDSYGGLLKSGLGWAAIGSYAMYDLILVYNDNGPAEFADIAEESKKTLVDDADYMLKKGSEDGYNMPLLANYPWGSNMTVANNGIALIMAAAITGNDEYRVFAKKQLDYLLGANSLGYCFVTGYGTVCPEHPHHRPSEVNEQAVPGMLVGGPNNGLNDSYAKAVLNECAPSQCYADNAQTYSCNEVTIYWNSPLIYLMSEFK